MSGFDAVTACELAEELAEAIWVETERLSSDPHPLAEVGRVREAIAADYAEAVWPLQDDPWLLEGVPDELRERLEVALGKVRAALVESEAAIRAEIGLSQRILHSTIHAVEDSAQSAGYSADATWRPRAGANLAFALRDHC